MPRFLPTSSPSREGRPKKTTSKENMTLNVSGRHDESQHQEAENTAMDRPQA